MYTSSGHTAPEQGLILSKVERGTSGKNQADTAYSSVRTAPASTGVGLQIPGSPAWVEKEASLSPALLGGVHACRSQESTVVSSICLFFPPPELQLRRQLSFSEDSDLSSDDILDRSSQKSRREVCRGQAQPKPL